MIVGAHSFPVTGDGEHNFSTICAAAERAAEVGAELLLFPECALTGFPPRDILSSAAVDFLRLAEMHAALHKLSDARNLALIVGSMVPAENGVRNAVMIFRPGEEPLIYAKRALWGWDRDNFVPGNAPGVFSFRGWKIGVRICYEVRFPEYFRELYRARCDLALTPFYDVTDAPSPDRYDLLRASAHPCGGERIPRALRQRHCSVPRRADHAVRRFGAHSRRKPAGCAASAALRSLQTRAGFRGTRADRTLRQPCAIAFRKQKHRPMPYAVASDDVSYFSRSIHSLSRTNTSCLSASEIVPLFFTA